MRNTRKTVEIWLSICFTHLIPSPMQNSTEEHHIGDKTTQMAVDWPRLQNAAEHNLTWGKLEKTSRDKLQWRALVLALCALPHEEE